MLQTLLNCITEAHRIQQYAKFGPWETKGELMTILKQAVQIYPPRAYRNVNLNIFESRISYLNTRIYNQFKINARNPF